MARNIEWKARVRDLDALIAQTRADLGVEPELIEQDDSFFTCATGRLKLRRFAHGHGELIFYRRPDVEGPKLSEYTIVPTDAPGRLSELLAQALGSAGRVIKHRTLLRAGSTRLHFDRVQGLGEFVEIEVVLEDGEPVEAGEAEAAAWLVRLGIEPSARIAGAYVDLLRAAAEAAC